MTKLFIRASLLYNNKTDTVANKHRVTQVISHELAHQWVTKI
jgi:aminopeptidase N